jgi:hypothetical protein
MKTLLKIAGYIMVICAGVIIVLVIISMLTGCIRSNNDNIAYVHHSDGSMSNVPSSWDVMYNDTHFSIYEGQYSNAKETAFVIADQINSGYIPETIFYNIDIQNSKVKFISDSLKTI